MCSVYFFLVLEQFLCASVCFLRKTMKLETELCFVVALPEMVADPNSIARPGSASKKFVNPDLDLHASDADLRHCLT
jgi:hypothetical protein